MLFPVLRWQSYDFVIIQQKNATKKYKNYYFSFYLIVLLACCPLFFAFKGLLLT